MKGKNRTKVKQEYDKWTSILQNLVNTCNNNYLTLLSNLVTTIPPFPSFSTALFKRAYVGHLVLKLSRKFSLVVHQHQMAASHAHHCLKVCRSVLICLSRVTDADFSLQELYQPWKDTTLRKKQLKIVIVLNILNGQKKLKATGMNCQVLPATICPSNVLPSDPSDSKPSESNTRTGRPFGPEEK